MIVVSNTSPLTNLATVGHLDLLRQLYERVIIPMAVHRELARLDAGHPGPVDIDNLSRLFREHPV